MLFIKKYPQWYEKTIKIFFLFSNYSCEVRFSSCISTETTYYEMDNKKQIWESSFFY